MTEEQGWSWERVDRLVSRMRSQGYTAMEAEAREALVWALDSAAAHDCQEVGSSRGLAEEVVTRGPRVPGFPTVLSPGSRWRMVLCRVHGSTFMPDPDGGKPRWCHVATMWRWVENGADDPVVEECEAVGFDAWDIG